MTTLQAEHVATPDSDQQTLLVTSSRTWINARLAKEWFTRLHAEGYDVFMHGDAPRGGDRLCRQLAPVIGYTHDPHPADWLKHGKIAGFIRNADMVATKPDHWLALADICRVPGCTREPVPHMSHGTWDCVTRCMQAEIPGVVVWPNGDYEPTGLRSKG